MNKKRTIALQTEADQMLDCSAGNPQLLSISVVLLHSVVDPHRHRLVARIMANCKHTLTHSIHSECGLFQWPGKILCHSLQKARGFLPKYTSLFVQVVYHGNTKLPKYLAADITFRITLLVVLLHHRLLRCTCTSETSVCVCVCMS